MSRGSGGRSGTRDGRADPVRCARSSVPMTLDRARAIQAHADRTGTNQEFQARAMAAAVRNEATVEEDRDDDQELED